MRAADIVAPVLSTPEVVALFFARVAAQTSFGSFLRRLVLERNDLRWIAFRNMVLAWAMTRLAAGYFVFPTTHRAQLRMRRVRISLELILVTIFAGVAAD